MNKQVILAVVLFYVVSNPATYKLVESFLGRFFRIARNGSPTSAGLLVHAAVFGALLMFLFPKVSGFDREQKRKERQMQYKEKRDRIKKQWEENQKDMMQKRRESRKTPSVK